jgi:YHS domain-containing protein
MIVHSPRHCRVASGISIVLAMLGAGEFMETARALEPEAIAWRDDYSRALEEARAANRLVWIQFTGPWCPNCTRMERDSFPHPAVVQHARDSFVPVKLRSDVNEQLALGFNLSGLPATIIVTPEGVILASHQGYLGPEEFEAFLRESLSHMVEKPGNSERDTVPNTAPGSVGRLASQPTDDEPLALAGYCPVSLVRDRKLVPGQTEYTVNHAGWKYRFASLDSSDRFRKEPNSYVPAKNGSCPVNQLDHGKARTGDPRWGVLYKSHLFLCASEEDRRRFLENPERYAMVDVAEGGFCLHCIRESGLLVRGDQRHEVARQGWRYWFPDETHRDAFLASFADSDRIKK